ncbi:hypothetical protein ACFPL7_00825 [Dongia soli]|uniref:Uncharacterized protein n=1 Tax=Dongia soli TaxID=600628 RepID=A0ABU5EES2_9PROT|nr:hypothetical protein [Dongia soli]MDY0884349.1 hypothetical protein [Dongia soli]
MRIILSPLMRIAALACLIAPLQPAFASADLQTSLTIRNDGGEALKCVILFGHWVTSDIADIAPGQTGEVKIMRAAKDGALYVPRFDGRPMMIERIACGRTAGWWESIGDVPLLPLREKAEAASETRCRLSDRAVCTTPQPAMP